MRGNIPFLPIEGIRGEGGGGRVRKSNPGHGSAPPPPAPCRAPWRQEDGAGATRQFGTTHRQRGVCGAASAAPQRQSWHCGAHCPVWGDCGEARRPRLSVSSKEVVITAAARRSDPQFPLPCGGPRAAQSGYRMAKVVDNSPPCSAALHQKTSRGPTSSANCVLRTA
eukprot:gene17808-biopygen12915